jgi:Ser/Thr protein kinase RdoA (MazF antagonist)
LQVTLDTTPRFAPAEAAEFAQQIFGLTAGVSKLPSERDQNFLLEVAGNSRFVLKIAKADEHRGVLEFQNAALRRVAGRAPALIVPRLHPTRLGEELAQVNDPHGRAHYVRLFSWLDGTMLADATPHDAALLVSLGVTMADIDGALHGFFHAAMHRELHWDLRHADLALEHLTLLPAAQQRLVQAVMRDWSEIDWRGLRHGVIHGDANDHNVLVRLGRVVGLIDFGDLVHSAVVCDLAIALAYAMLDKPRPVEVAGTIVRAYQERLPLNGCELDALYPLIGARLCMSVCYAAYNARAKSGDAYQQVTAAPAWNLLQQLAGLSPECARAAWAQGQRVQ